MEHPQRKTNRLPDYDYSSPGAYFITICTQDKKPILGDIVGGGALDAPCVRLSETGTIVYRHITSGNRIPGICVDKFVIMPNHIHIILLVYAPASSGVSKASSPTNASVPHYVSTLKRFCHRDVGRKIFQRSYHDHVIRGEKDYQKIWQYIDSNPTRWQKDCFYTEQPAWGVEGAAPYITPMEERT